MVVFRAMDETALKDFANGSAPSGVVLERGQRVRIADYGAKNPRGFYYDCAEDGKVFFGNKISPLLYELGCRRMEKRRVVIPREPGTTLVNKLIDDEIRATRYVSHPSFKKDARALVDVPVPEEYRRVIFTMDPGAEWRGEIPQLTRKQEAEFFLQYNAAKYLSNTQLSLMRTKKAYDAELLNYCLERTGDLRSVLLNLNLPLVRLMGKRFLFNQNDPENLLAEGDLKLLTAIDFFDASKGFKFSTYACRALYTEFCKLLNDRTRHLDVFPAEFEESCQVDDTIDRRHEEQEAYLIEELQRVMQSKVLTPLEKRILSERFGFGGDEKTLKEVGQGLKLSNERVRQIQKRSLRKLKGVLALRA